MGKEKKSIVRAQRKFAQGAYVPPQSAPVSAPTQVTVNASHRAVSAPGPVTKNVCSANDLLTSMSLRKAHQHTVNWPIVVLQDCVKMLGMEYEKKKLEGVKKKQKPRSLRNTRKHVSDVDDSSVSDSDDDDIPLSHLQNQQAILSKQVKNVPVEKKLYTEGNRSRTTKTDTDKASDHGNPTSPKIGLKQTTNDNIQTYTKLHAQPVLFDRKWGKNPQPAPEQPRKRRIANPKSSSSKLNLLHDQHDPLVLRSSKTSKGRVTNGSDNTTSSIISSRIGDKTKLTGLIGTRELSPKAHDSPSSTDQPASTNESLKRRAERLEDLQQVKECGLIKKKKALRVQNFCKHQEPDPLKKIKEVKECQKKGHPQIICEQGPDSQNKIPDEWHFSSDQNTKYYTQDTNNKQVTSTIHSITCVTTDVSNIANLTSSRDPLVSAQITKCTKTQCPLRLIVDLHALLSSEVACNTCRRCTLITMYKDILKKVPKSRNDEPDIGAQPPLAWPFDINQTTKRREKVSKVLTSKKLLIWLINPQIELHMHMFEIEHNAGRLIRTFKLDTKDVADTQVEKVISRIEFLDSCIKHDNEELTLSMPLPMPTISPIDLSMKSTVNLVTDEEPVLGPDPPVYRPTLEEFQDPIIYIKSIEKEASKYGICKIIPPDGFHVPCHLNENCQFDTTKQHLGRLYNRWGPNTKKTATIQTSATWQTPGEKEHFTKAPLFSGIEVDLVKLYDLILNEGGIEGYLSSKEKWARIGAKMNLLFPGSKHNWKTLENIYCKHILPYATLTLEEREAAAIKVERIWKIREKNSVLRASQPLYYQKSMLSVSNLPEYEEDVPDAYIADLYNLCKPIFDNIEECISKGRAMNLASFRRLSTKIQKMRFPNGLPSIAEIERQYWEILNLGNEHVCVLSAFIDTSVNSLGHESDPTKPGGNQPWNLKRIGENTNNVLHSLGKVLSVTVPTLCLNQLFSTNCWHKDPHKLAWMDYMHEGATKIWYSIPDSGAPAFRRAVERTTVAAVQGKGIWLASDTTMIPPGNLMACGVPVKRIEQNPNEYIVVFPGAYASSISTGLSVAESIYFETNSWLDHVEKVVEDMQKDCEPAMFSCVLLMMNMARNPTFSFDILKQVCNLLKKFIKIEIQARREALWLSCRATTDKRGREEGNLLPVSWPNQEECCLCRVPLVLSKMSKYDEPRKKMCINHGMEYMRIMNKSEENRPEQLPLLTMHYTNQELIEMMGTLELYVMGND